MDIMEYTRGLRETRMRVANELKGFLEDVHRRHPGEEMTAEEAAQFQRYNERLDELKNQVEQLDKAETREREAAVASEAIDRAVGEETHQQSQRSEAAALRAWFSGAERRHEDFESNRNALAVDLSRAARLQTAIRQGADPAEARALLWDTGSAGSLVPTTLERSLYQYLEASIAMFRAPTTKIQTMSGEPIQFPRVATHGVGTQVIAQGTAIGGSDPVFARMQLDAYKYGQLVQIASEVVTDEVVDIIDFVASNVGRAVGRLIDADLVVGGGSGEPNGIMNAATSNITTGGSTINPTYEKLVDQVYLVNDAYRATGNAGWLMNDSTAGYLRKLRDGAGGTVGAVLWEPSLTAGIQNGQPDRLLGFPVYTDPNVAALASASKSIFFGDFSAYYIRQVGNFVFERSDDFAFNTDLVSFRGKWRADGDLIDVSATSVMQRAV